MKLQCFGTTEDASVIIFTVVIEMDFTDIETAQERRSHCATCAFFLEQCRVCAG